IQYLKSLNYPLEVIQSFEFNSLYGLMLKDKKNDQQGVQMVLLNAIGDPQVKHVDKATLSQAFEIFTTHFEK
ncbi:MAG UNVERIFIED_CONTAM: 3-dehydroquinate synthase, partial [Staphylococcus saprophyticus]